MDAQDNLKIIHTVDGTSLQNRYGKSVIQSHDIGLISLPTGEIVMADPTLRFEIADFKRKAFQQKVRPGMYPVFAYTAHSDRDCVLAFAEICFTDRPPVTFKAAKTLWDTERSRRRNCGYVVSESTTGFMDGQYFKDACMKSEFSDLEHEMVLDEGESGALGNTMRSRDLSGRQLLSGPFYRSKRSLLLVLGKGPERRDLLLGG